MVDLVAETLGLAVGIAISPVPIAAVILMLFSERSRVNSVSFLVAWLVGIAAVAGLVLVLPGLGADQGAPSDGVGWFKLALGALLFAVGVRQWRARPTGDAEPDAPAWMARIDELRPPAAFGLGFLLSAINPKNLLLGAAAGATMAASEPAAGDAVAAIAVYTLIAAATVIVPVVGYLVAGERLDRTLDQAKSWLIANNSAVLAVLFAVFGALQIGDAINILV